VGRWDRLLWSALYRAFTAAWGAEGGTVKLLPFTALSGAVVALVLRDGWAGAVIGALIGTGIPFVGLLGVDNRRQELLPRFLPQTFQEGEVEACQHLDGWLGADQQRRPRPRNAR
jgi:hypothetical protein